MATRTSSPSASRSKSTPTRKSGQGGSTSRSRPSGSKSGRKPAPKSSTSTRQKGGSPARRPAPRAVRNGPGPVSKVFLGLARMLMAVWLGLAHAVGAGVRRVGHTTSSLEPEQRRDGAGLFLIGLAVVVAAAV